MSKLPTTILLAASLIAAFAFGQQTQARKDMEITRNGARPSQEGPSDWFTGSVRIDTLFTAREGGNRAHASNVTFEPGARTAWHTHPLGQTLIVTSGLGWAQVEGGPVQELRPGDVVWFPPNTRHWHGASATVGMSHIATQEELNGKVVEWMEKVTDAQYRAPAVGLLDENRTDSK